MRARVGARSLTLRLPKSAEGQVPVKSRKSNRAAFWAAPRRSVMRQRCLVRRALGVRRERRIGGHAAEQVECRLERFVVLGVRRHERLRAGLLVAFGLEMTAQRGFALGVGAGFEILRYVLKDF